MITGTKEIAEEIDKIEKDMNGKQKAEAFAEHTKNELRKYNREAQRKHRIKANVE